MCSWRATGIVATPRRTFTKRLPHPESVVRTNAHANGPVARHRQNEAFVLPSLGSVGVVVASTVRTRECTFDPASTIALSLLLLGRSDCLQCHFGSQLLSILPRVFVYVDPSGAGESSLCSVEG